MPFPSKMTPLKDYTEFLQTFSWLLLGHMTPQNCNWLQGIGFLWENCKEKEKKSLFVCKLDSTHPYSLILNQFLSKIFPNPSLLNLTFSWRLTDCWFGIQSFKHFHFSRWMLLGDGSSGPVFIHAFSKHEQRDYYRYFPQCSDIEVAQ